MADSTGAAVGAVVGLSIVVIIEIALADVSLRFVAVVALGASLGALVGFDYVGAAVGAAVGLGLAVLLRRRGILDVCWIPRRKGESIVSYYRANVGTLLRHP